ncbi:hypothetical protein BH23CYA1_BH23CYA1_07370 [soil metagenome]|uniref:hypothetical protein n=1 Tax=Leptolyngbya sp. BC1307 TaxID=2029589 RepID=UPI000EFB0854|nr:hypothetical protein [Leptolyngbya sp. BC1307]
MVRGLLWLPLLFLFIGLTWAGWNEYRKVEFYKGWAQQFERAKYDIYAALGQQGDVLTWGVPTRKGVIDAATLDLTEVKRVDIEVNDRPVDPDQLPNKGRFALGFTLRNGQHLSVPFTEGAIARQWFDFLRQKWSLPL